MAMLWSPEGQNAMLAIVVATMFVCLVIFKFVRAALWEPLRLRHLMTKQGVSGPPFKFLLGQYPDMLKFAKSFPEALAMDDFANLSPTVSPQYAMYFPKYGKVFLYWWGTVSRLVVGDPEIVKELLVTNHDFLEKSDLENMLISQVAGQGLLSQVGEKWKSERRTMNPSFNPHALKAMAKAIVEGTTLEMQFWEQKVAKAGGELEIDVELGMDNISGTIISRVLCNDNYEKAEHIYKFQKILAHQVLKMFQSPLYWFIPGYRYLPTKGNRLMNTCNSKIDALLHDIVISRQRAIQKRGLSNYENVDILEYMLTSATNGWDENVQEFNMASVFNQFKLLTFAGQDTVSTILTFAMLMLALHPEWQERARVEALEVLDEEWNITISTMSRLKVMNMVCNETLRLFPPGVFLTRVATKDLQLKGLFIPKGLPIECALVAIQQDKDYWGADVGKFNPGRFANGMSEACSHRQAFFPFGLGPRTCLGNNLGNMIVTTVIAMVLRRFQLLPSPNYKHHPTCFLIQKPKFGMPIILKALKSAQ